MKTDMRKRKPLTQQDREKIAIYQSENTSTVNIRLFPSDNDIKKHLEEIEEPKATYIKRLIRDDMRKSKK